MHYILKKKQKQLTCFNIAESSSRGKQLIAKQHIPCQIYDLLPWTFTSASKREAGSIINVLLN